MTFLTKLGEQCNSHHGDSPAQLHGGQGSAIQECLSGRSLHRPNPTSYVALPTHDEFDGAQTPQQYPLVEDADMVEKEQDLHSNFRFVEAGWFQSIAAVVIVTNIIIIVMEADDKSNKIKFFWVDQFMLVFYVFELVARSCFFKRRYIVGPIKFVAWNYLDIAVVGAAVLDQCILPVLPVPKTKPLTSILSLLRLLRLFRVLKIIRIFLEIDLSWTEEPKFQSFIGIVIGFNALLMGMETDIDWSGWFYIEQVLLTIYVFELAVRLKRFGLSFLSCHNPDILWNVLDFVIVASSTLDSWVIPLISVISKSLAEDDANGKKSGGIKIGQVMMLMRMMRLMRILRLVKLVKSVRPLFILVTGVLSALQGVAWVLVLTVVVLYAMGIMATRLIGHGMLFPAGADIPESILIPFQTVPDSMFTLFRVMSGAASDDEATAIDELMKALPTVKFAFVFFMITSSWTLLSILTAVVSENMITCTGQQEEEMKLAHAEEDREAHTKDLKDLFSSIDESGDGEVDQAEIKKFLDDTSKAMETAKLCRVPLRDVFDVIQTLSLDGAPVNMNKFVECLVDVGNPVTEKSVMKLESRLTNLQEKSQEAMQAITQELRAVEGVAQKQVENLKLEELIASTIASLEERMKEVQQKTAQAFETLENRLHLQEEFERKEFQRQGAALEKLAATLEEHSLKALVRAAMPEPLPQVEGFASSSHEPAADPARSAETTRYCTSVERHSSESASSDSVNQADPGQALPADHRARTADVGETTTPSVRYAKSSTEGSDIPLPIPLGNQAPKEESFVRISVPADLTPDAEDLGKKSELSASVNIGNRLTEVTGPNFTISSCHYVDIRVHEADSSSEERVPGNDHNTATTSGKFRAETGESCDS